MGVKCGKAQRRLFFQCLPHLPVVAKRYSGVCLRTSLFPVESNPAGKSHAFQSCETVGSLTGDFYNQSQKARKTEDVFTYELQILVTKIVACKPEFWGGKSGSQTLI